MSFIQRLAKVKRKSFIIISVVILCSVFEGIGVAKYTNGVQVKSGISLGNKYLQEGKYEEAILAFQKVIKIDPKNIEARVGLAQAYVKTGNQDEAEKVLKEAININPKRVEPYLELAKLYITENNPVNAFKILSDGYKATKDDKTKTMLEDLKAKITVGDIINTITLGGNYTLPNTITVKINNTEVQFPVKWDTSTVDTTKVGIKTYTGTLENTDKIVKLTLNILAIVSIEDINNKVMKNDKYSLPAKVKAKMSDNSTQDVEVTWSPSVVDTSKAGSYSYQGTVIGYNGKIKLTLDVVGVASIENIYITINQKDKYLLPTKVKAKMTDESTQDVVVKWNSSSIDTSKVGNYSYQGTVENYDKKVMLNLIIKSKVVDTKVSIITGSSVEPASIKDKNTIVLNGIGKGEFVEIVIKGEIVNFKLVELRWNQTQNNLQEVKTLNRIDKLTNQTIVIKTYVPEGIPYEKIKWQSVSGKNYEHIIQYDGRDDGDGVTEIITQ